MMNCGDMTYAQALQYPEAHYRIDICEACIDQSLWHCITHLHFYTLFHLFGMGMSVVALFGVFTICPYILWRCRP